MKTLEDFTKRAKSCGYNWVAVDEDRDCFGL